MRPAARLAVAALVMAALTAALYSRVLHAPFVFDDEIIATSRATQVASPWEAAHLLASGLPRTLTRATFALNFLAGWLDPFGYHVVNLALHALNGWLLFVLAATLLACLPDDHPWRRRSVPIAAAGSLLWLAHPVQTQAVSYIWQRSTGLCACFYLATVILYVRARRGTGWRRWGMAAAAVGTALAALAAKENAGSLPGALALVEVVFVRPTAPAVPARSRDGDPAPWWRRWGWAVAFAAASVFIALDYLGPRFVPMMAGDFARRGFTLGERLLTEARVVVYYASLLVFPHPGRLTLDYDIPVSRGLFNPITTAASLALVVAAVAWSLAALRRRSLAAFAALWFLGLLVIESTVVPLDLAYEHRLYLPSAVPIVFAAGAVLTARVPARARALRIGAVALALVVCAVWTWQRNEVWRDPVRLFADTAAKSPRKARVHVNLGKALRQAGNARGAAAAYERALDIDPQSLEALTALASLSMDELGDDRRADELLAEARRLAPSYGAARNNLGVLRMRQGRQDEAAVLFGESLAQEPHDQLAIYNLAAVHVNTREYERAEQLLAEGIRAWPGSQKMRALLALTFVARGDLEGAARAVAPAAARSPRDPMVAAVLDEIGKRRERVRAGG